MRILSHPVGVVPPLAPRPLLWDRALDPALVSAPGNAAAVEWLHRPDALVVTTGQQPGLFTGPLYTIHKALAAGALAQRLERQWQRPVVALLWVAGDDHDWTEASAAAWLDAEGRLVRWQLPARPATAAQLPMYREAVPLEIEEGLRLLEDSLPGGPLRDATMTWLRRHYHSGATLQSAATGALAELLAPFGVLVFDPTHPVMKAAQAPLLSKALEQAAALDQLLAALPPLAGGVAVGGGATLVCLETTAGRERLVFDGSHFRARRSGEQFTLPEIQSLLNQSPERFSPNALLRPVVEAAILPTVGYVGGPGELRYLNAQASALYQPLGVWRQPPVPRWSGTVVEAWADRLLGRLDLTLEQLLGDDDGVLGRELLRRDLPPRIGDALATLGKVIEEQGSNLREVGRALDPVLDRAIEGRQRKLAHVVADLQKLVERHLRKRDDIAWAQYRRLRTGLRPQDAPQERVLCAPSFHARHGIPWLEAIAEAARRWATAG